MDGERRKLPLWMNKSEEPKVPKIVPKSRPEKQISEEGSGSGLITKTRKRKILSKEKPNWKDGKGLVECESKRRKRKLSDGNISGKSKSSDDEIEIHSASDEDLTMEDLISIAKEYVNGDMEFEQQQPSGTENEAASQKNQVVVSSRNEEPRIRPDATQLLPMHKEVVTLRNNIADNSRSERIVASTSRTGDGDTAQDMLDLFLGPLLNKPTGEKKITPISEDIKFSFEYKPQNSDIPKERQAPLTKKKSSLKDMVAMFLD